MKVVWLGLWRKDTKDKMPEFAERHLSLAPVIQEYLEAIELFLAPIEGNRRLRERIEGAIAHQIREQSAPASSLLPPDIRYRSRMQSEVPVSLDIECDQVVLGLPSQMVV
jgi:hypothetical protein